MEKEDAGEIGCLYRKKQMILSDNLFVIPVSNLPTLLFYFFRPIGLDQLLDRTRFAVEMPHLDSGLHSFCDCLGGFGWICED